MRASDFLSDLTPLPRLMRMPAAKRIPGLCAATLLLAFVFLVSTAESLAAQQSEWEAQVDRYLGVSSGRQPGYARLGGPPARGSLSEDEINVVSLEVPGPGDYLVIVACDDDCAGLELSGREPLRAESLGKEPDFPVLRFLASGRGRVEVQVRMLACGQQPCQFGVELLQRRM